MSGDLRACPTCSASVSRQADFCPHCGRPLASKRKPLGCGTLILGVAAIWALVSWATSANDPPEVRARKAAARAEARAAAEREAAERRAVVAKHGSPSDVKVECQMRMEAALRAPSTAKFPGAFDGAPDPVLTDAGTWLYRSWVDAQNGYGAMIRTPYLCEMKKGPAGWRVLRFEAGD